MLCFASSATAQEGPEQGPAVAAPAAVVPPALLEDAEAHYPEQALVEGREAVIVLRLTLDADGRVRNAEVVAPAGHGFDEAALEVAKRLRFSPALRDGKAIAVRILYEHEFRLPAAAHTADQPSAPSAPALPTAPAPPPASEATSTKNELISGANGPADASTQPQDLEVVVRGVTAAEALRKSARAVKVVETEKVKRESADMGSVLSRVEGVSVRRSGGLGSDTRFALNGLSGEQVRFFLDGIPLSLAGYPSGLANVPINLVERVEIYSGVVPIHFGADALGGAVNLVTDHATTGTHASGSYQVGSFGTHHVTLAARTLQPKSGLFARFEGFYDRSKNNYDVAVRVPDELGRPHEVEVPRFHDAYRASGGSLEFGVVDRPYAKRLLARVFVADYDKQVQHNWIMAVPYGGVEFGETSYGGSLRFEHDLSDELTLGLLGGYTRNVIRYLDVSECFYDWYGRCLFPNQAPGELDSQAHDQRHYQDAYLARANLGWQVQREHALRLSISPTLVRRTGEERRLPDHDSVDPLSARRRLDTLVAGIEWQTNPYDDLIENILFAKSYSQWLRSEEIVSGALPVDRNRTSHDPGFGDSLRVRASEWLYLKASYEYATRLPQPHEVFGDGRFVTPNLELSPERSHNGNLGASAEHVLSGFGTARCTINLFLRDKHDEIRLLGDERKLTYANVLEARITGIEGALGWTSPRRHLELDGNATYQSARNRSTEGTFAPYEGDRLPNLPYFLANGQATARVEDVLDRRDELSLTWYTSYVHEFYRGWESLGRRDSKQVVEAQLLHTVALTHTLTTAAAKVSSTFEVDNVSNARAYDFFGAQKPGRAFFVKTTLEL